GLGNLAALMSNAQGISGRIDKVSDELKTKRAKGAAGGGMVEVEVNGLGQVLSVTIDSQLVESNDRDMIQDLLPAAFNEAASKAKQMHVEAMRELTGGMSLPVLDDMIEKYAGSATDDGPSPGASQTD
ncbi:MAG: YbaB/EbfC family nucleoid-associated protein, partial [Pirellulaceae bacterium]|nr:YbaB/EbfC family nucleoid-associated protein [Pirellulaceae bacterium]